MIHKFLGRMKECIDFMELAIRGLKNSASCFEYHKYLTIFRDMLKSSDRQDKIPQVEEEIRQADEELKKLSEKYKNQAPLA